MKEFKGTPGPWSLNKHDIFSEHVSDEYNFISAVCSYLDKQTKKGFMLSGCVSTSDAQLIAAAPDLLEALQNMVTSYEFEASSDNPSLLAARAAISKALGE